MTPIEKKDVAKPNGKDDSLWDIIVELRLSEQELHYLVMEKYQILNRLLSIEYNELRADNTENNNLVRLRTKKQLEINELRESMSSYEVLNKKHRVLIDDFENLYLAIEKLKNRYTELKHQFNIAKEFNENFCKIFSKHGNGTDGSNGTITPVDEFAK
ncbi:hypothetical protein CANARDRAFT_10509 [[Candida] arabinofermentans NRRL YB-2248]|uniref:Autophagy-related protein 16 domain-containing protein n=1 Tax=[Candida] arabinofermentans NRRL YB-2248 TaxID=983967 RepID=A0A1E4SSM1_9ASCO|nr:hypothetical protein CANARDRAFT_10509 [[Candida] arabinofermentans NRRL YB-2248]